MVEVDGSTVEAAWVPLADVLSGAVPTVPVVREALADHRPARRQRIAAYAVILREDRILLSRLSPNVSHSELWTLPGGGLDHGESPRDAVVREVYEETGEYLASVTERDVEVLRALNDIPLENDEFGQWPTFSVQLPPNVLRGFIEMTSEASSDRDRFELLMRLAGWQG